MKRITSSIALLLLGICCKAQTEGFAYKASLDSVKASGFYNIEILPPVSLHCKTDYSDIRIVNGQGKWVPHLLRLPSEEYHVATLIADMPFVSKIVAASAVTCVVKSSALLVSHIQLVMKNTSAQRSCSISGSMDGKEWFIINDSIRLQEVATTKGDETTCHLQFPPSSYAYFKLVVDSKKTDPVNIVQLGLVDGAYEALPASAKKRLQDNPNCTLVQKDSAKASYIQVTQPAAYQFEWLALQVSGVKYFNRKVDVYIPDGNEHSFAKPGRLLQTITISNNSTLQFYLPQVKTKVFYLIVHNDDNLPLQMVSVKTALRYRVLSTYLEKGERYQLLMGNPGAVAPVYDLVQLNGKLPKLDIPTLSMIGPISATGAATELPATAPKGNNPYLLWGSIGLALLILLYFTTKLLKEVNKQKGLEQEN